MNGGRVGSEQCAENGGHGSEQCAENSAQNLIAGSEQLPNVTLAAIFFWIVARFSTSSRALRSAMYRDSESFAKLSEICTSCKIA